MVDGLRILLRWIDAGFERFQEEEIGTLSLSIMTDRKGGIRGC